MVRSLILVLAAVLQLSSQFQPARVVSSPFGGVPYGSRAAGVIVLDVDVDQGGTVRGINTLKDLEPFGDVIRSSVSSWRFEPARERGQAVEHPILVAVLVRPAMVMFPAPPPPPGPPPGLTHSIPIPTSFGIPAYPPNRIGVAAVLVEVEIDFQGTVTSARIKGETSGFDDTSLDAARRWTFRPARHKNLDVPSCGYLLFIFRQPVT
jgi:TonB family protein